MCFLCLRVFLSNVSYLKQPQSESRKHSYYYIFLKAFLREEEKRKDEKRQKRQRRTFFVTLSI